MSRLKQHKQDLIAMASHGVDETTRAHLTKLIESDEECAAYWQELVILTETIASSQQAATANPLPEGFHFELRQEIKRSERIGKAQPVKRPFQLLLKPAIALSVIATAILLGIQFFKTPQNGSSNVASMPSSPPKPPLAPYSWAALRKAHQAPVTPTITTPTVLAPQATPSMAWSDRSSLIEALDL